MPGEGRGPETGQIPVRAGERPAPPAGVHHRPAPDRQVSGAGPLHRDDRFPVPKDASSGGSFDNADPNAASFPDRPGIEPVPPHQPLTLTPSLVGLRRDPVLSPAPPHEMVCRPGRVHRPRKIQTPGPEKSGVGRRECLSEVLPSSHRGMDEGGTQAEVRELARGESPGGAATHHDRVRSDLARRVRDRPQPADYRFSARTRASASSTPRSTRSRCSSFSQSFRRLIAVPKSAIIASMYARSASTTIDRPPITT